MSNSFTVRQHDEPTSFHNSEVLGPVMAPSSNLGKGIQNREERVGPLNSEINVREESRNAKNSTASGFNDVKKPCRNGRIDE